MVKHMLGHTCVLLCVWKGVYIPFQIIILSYLHNIPRKEKTKFFGAKRQITL